MVPFRASGFSWLQYRKWSMWCFAASRLMRLVISDISNVKIRKNGVWTWKIFSCLILLYWLFLLCNFPAISSRRIYYAQTWEWSAAQEHEWHRKWSFVVEVVSRTGNVQESQLKEIEQTVQSKEELLLADLKSVSHWSFLSFDSNISAAPCRKTKPWR